MRGPSSLSVAERELLAAYVSSLNHCKYCADIHASTAERLGESRGVVARLANNMEGAPIAEKMRPILRYAKKLTEQSAAITQTDTEAILEAGWDETALFHSIAVTALFNAMNRLVGGLGIEAKTDYVEIASQRLAEHGYRPLIEMVED